MTQNSCILLERDGAVGIVTINNPEKRNSLSDDVLSELVTTIQDLDFDQEVRAIVLAGSDKVFASGADVGSLLERETSEAFDGTRSRDWEKLRRVRTPFIAAVSGFCLGGGCELALMADIVIASETARFGLPETQLGLIPGAGGTQMLPRAIGKAKAMDVVLTGRLLDATEAENDGLVSRVVPVDEVLEVARDAAQKVAARPAVAQRLAKQVISESAGVDLETGISNERKAFAIAFASHDAREGMSAFLEKRDPEFRHR